ncbi:hypothetical protein D3C76_895590 [compost metagenome]
MKDNVLPSVLRALNDNQIAIAAAVEELAKWVEDRGSVRIGRHVRDCLDHLDRNQKSIDEGITKAIPDRLIIRPIDFNCLLFRCPH